MLTPEAICDALSEAGLTLAPSDVQIDPREGRIAAFLPGERIAWFPTTVAGRRALAVERRVLELLEARCSFRVPRVLFVSPAGFDLREMVPGLHDPWRLYRTLDHDDALGTRLGLELGRILAEQHTRITAADVAGWLPTELGWPEPLDRMRERLPRVIDDRGLLAAVLEALRAYEQQTVDPADLVLVHGDLGLHNLALDPATLEVEGVFDYEEAAWADRHHDFRYFIFDVGREAMLEAALSVYEPSTGRAISRAKVALANAICSASFLSIREGRPPEDKSCGRTLAEDLRWIRGALARFAQL